MSQPKGPTLHQLHFVVEALRHPMGVAMPKVAGKRFKPPAECTAVLWYFPGFTGVHNPMIFGVNKAYPYKSSWIRWNKCVTFTIP